MVVVRPFREGDGRWLMEIAPRAFLKLGLDRLALDKSLPRDAVREAYLREAEGYIKRVTEGDKNIEIIVAEERGSVRGYLVLGINAERSEIFQFKWAQILSLAVDPDWWSKGVGSKLVKGGLKRLKEKGVRYVEVFTDQNNVPAIRIYEKHGFRVIHSGITLSRHLEK